MIRIVEDKGFHLELDNGVTVSVQIGTYNYCNSKKVDRNRESNTAEVAVFRTEDGEWMTKEVAKMADVSFNGEDDVIGHVSTSDLLSIITAAATHTEDTEKHGQ